MAAELCFILKARLNLVNFVPPMRPLKGQQAGEGRFSPATANALLGMTEYMALDYLEEKSIPIRE